MIVVGAAKCRFCGAIFDPRLKAAGKKDLRPDDENLTGGLGLLHPLWRHRLHRRNRLRDSRQTQRDEDGRDFARRGKWSERAVRDRSSGHARSQSLPLTPSSRIPRHVRNHYLPLWSTGPLAGADGEPGVSLSAMQERHRLDVGCPGPGLHAAEARRRGLVLPHLPVGDCRRGAGGHLPRSAIRFTIASAGRRSAAAAPTAASRRRRWKKARPRRSP